ncbi:hypothetical protein NDU88_007024 [Pleurodeles waltl]|uniref:Uncharacterized protein n=1 Tax=Pleurodeles waltl TaxID=8319 RepID=A0AAV7PN36_PLEWA|nr:hypothetical protein NDU88_007024 [Pleurodeles waltl]
MSEVRCSGKDYRHNIMWRVLLQFSQFRAHDPERTLPGPTLVFNPTAAPVFHHYGDACRRLGVPARTIGIIYSVRFIDLEYEIRYLVCYD